MSNKIITIYKRKQALGLKLQNKIGQTILHRDEAIKNPLLFKALVEATKDKAILNIQDSLGQTAMHVAVRLGIVEAVECLLQHGADANLLCFDEQTALHIAIQYGRSEVVECLLRHSVNVTLQDMRGQTALHYAVCHGHKLTPVAHQGLIRAAKSNDTLNILDNEGRSALLMAAQRHDPELWQWLLEAGSNPYLCSPEQYAHNFLTAGVPVINTDNIPRLFITVLNEKKRAHTRRQVVLDFSLVGLLLFPEPQFKYESFPKDLSEPVAELQNPPYIDAFDKDWLEEAINSWLEREKRRHELFVANSISTTATKARLDFDRAVVDFDIAVGHLARIPEPKQTIFIQGLRFLCERLQGDKRQEAISELYIRLEALHPVAFTTQAASSVPVSQTSPAATSTAAAQTPLWMAGPSVFFAPVPTSLQMHAFQEQLNTHLRDVQCQVL